jgi:hypothetical protein
MMWNAGGTTIVRSTERMLLGLALDFASKLLLGGTGKGKLDELILLAGCLDKGWCWIVGKKCFG